VVLGASCTGGFEVFTQIHSKYESEYKADYISKYMFGTPEIHLHDLENIQKQIQKTKK